MEAQKPSRWMPALAVLLAGCALRVVLNDVAHYSPADETHYLSVARWLSDGYFANYPKVTRWYIDTPGTHDSPSVNRVVHFALATAACRIAPACDHRALAWLSTLAGMASLLLTWLLGRELFREKTALLAAAFSITSPLQLALGRRALQDEVVCAAVLVTLWVFLRALRARGLSMHLLVALTATLALGEKETLFLFAPAFLALWLRAFPWRGWQRRDLLFLLPPFLYYLLCAAIQGSATGFFTIVHIGQISIQHSDYSLQYQSGPPQLVLVDLLLLAPVVFLLAASAVALPKQRAKDGEGAAWLAVFTFAAVAVFLFAPKNPRYFVVGDPLVRLLAAWFVMERAPRWAWAVAACSAGAELWIFHRVFIERAVYDPTTFDLLRALDAIPRF